MIVFVGDKPSPRMTPDARPFEGASCQKRLFEWINEILPFNPVWLASQQFSFHDFMYRNLVFRIINQIDYTSLELLLFPNDTIFIALGDNASRALKGIEHFKLPHPSGKNRQVYNKSFMAKKLKECQQHVEKRNNEKHS